MNNTEKFPLSALVQRVPTSSNAKEFLRNRRNVGEVFAYDVKRGNVALARGSLFPKFLKSLHYYWVDSSVEVMYPSYEVSVHDAASNTDFEFLISGKISLRAQQEETLIKGIESRFTSKQNELPDEIIKDFIRDIVEDYEQASKASKSTVLSSIKFNGSEVEHETLKSRLEVALRESFGLSASLRVDVRSPVLEGFIKVVRAGVREESLRLTEKIGLSANPVHLGVKYEFHFTDNTDLERIFIESFVDFKTPKEAINDFITKSVRRVVRNITSGARPLDLEFQSNGIRYSAPLMENEIKQKMEDHLNGMITLDIEPTVGGTIKPEQWALDLADVVLHDYAGGVRLQVSTSLEVEDEIRAFLSHDDLKNLKEVLKELVINYFRDSVSLESVASAAELRTVVSDELKEIINNRIAPLGRKVYKLDLEAFDIGELADDVVEVRHSTPCRINNCVNKQPIKTTLRLKLFDIKVNKSRGITNKNDVEDFVKKALDNIIKNVLFDSDYVDLILKFKEEKVPIIKEEIESVVRSIGYDLQMFVSGPNSDAFELEGEGLRVGFEEREYVTKYDEHVKIKIYASVKVPDLEKIRDLLGPSDEENRSISHKIDTLIDRACRETLLSVTPVEFYFKFDAESAASGLEQNEDCRNEVSVSQKLRTRITSELNDALPDSKVDFIAVDRRSNELERRVEELQGEEGRVEFEVFPHQSGGDGELVKFFGSFNIEGVAGQHWTMFSNRDYGYDRNKPKWSEVYGAKFKNEESSAEILSEEVDRQIKLKAIGDEMQKLSEAVNYELSRILENTPMDFSQFSNYQRLEELQSSVSTRVSETVAKKFGLLIKNIRIKRAPTLLEKRLLKKREEMIEDESAETLAERKTRLKLHDIHNSQIENELKDLMQELSKLRKVGTPEHSPRVKSLRGRIETISGEDAGASYEVRKPTGVAGLEGLRSKKANKTEDLDFEAFLSGGSKTEAKLTESDEGLKEDADSSNQVIDLEESESDGKNS